MSWLRLYGCIFAISCWFVILVATQITDPSEVNGLLAIKKSLTDPKKHLQNWNKGDPCTSNWTGVFCSATIGKDGYLHVEKLHLLNMNLSGSLAPETAQLSHLQILDFMWNELTGSIPKEIGNIAPLRLLLLNGNKLSGSLPEELGDLANMNRIQVDQNNISGPLPKSFGKLNKIKHIHMNNNSISGQIPSELSNASTLLHVLLDNNNLSGYLPSELSKLPYLRILQLDNNNFEGTEVPPSYGNLSSLVKLSLRNCSLNGKLLDLSRISNLSYLDLSFNQLNGPIPSNKLSNNMTTIHLSDNHLNGSIPESFSHLPHLQKLSIRNNLLSGAVPASIWRNMPFSITARLMLDLQNNSFSTIVGDLDPPQNVTLRLKGNPLCKSANIRNIDRFCGTKAEGDKSLYSSTNSTKMCPIQACPLHNFFEYVPASPVPCYCASPILIGYRLKSPSFSYFPPFKHPFEVYVTSSLNLEVYQLSIHSYLWEEGPRLRMNLKLFPIFSDHHSNTFNTSEIQRLRGRFTSWEFPASDFFGPYELLNFTLLGPYSSIVAFETRSRNISKGTLAVIIAGAISFVLTILTVITLLVARSRTKYHHNLSRRRLSSRMMKMDGVKSFSFKEMTMSTDNFNISTQVGRGGYGKVYRGILSDNSVVAIKRAEEGSLQGQKEFLTEIELLSRLHHRNLVSLIGYCDEEEEEQMLVYEFMPNGTLRDWLSGKAESNMSFGMRLRVALGSAKGILYLHTEAQPPIFHRDIKATNILLDDKLTAKVADFGLSRLAPVLEEEGAVPSHVSTAVKGTPGYLDPEYFLTCKLTDKSDVYSLGVVFLELLTGMQPISHGKNIVREVNIAHQSGTISSIIDSKMGLYPPECLERFSALSLSCCSDSTKTRPSMLDVVRELENILKLMPETDTQLLSESTSAYSGQSPISSASYNAGRNIYTSSDNASGSALVSGDVPRILPR